MKPSVIGAPVYAYSEAFETYSGWFKPSVNEVSSVKCIIPCTFSLHTSMIVCRVMFHIIVVDQFSSQDLVEDERRHNIMQSDLKPQINGSLSLSLNMIHAWTTLK